MTTRQQTPPPRLLTVRQVAERLGVSGVAVRDWIRVGRLRALKLGRPRLDVFSRDRAPVRIAESDVDAFLRPASPVADATGDDNVLEPR